MEDPMDLDPVGWPSAARTPRQVPPEGNRRQLASSIHSPRARGSKNAGKRLHTKKRTNARLLQLLKDIHKLVKRDAIEFLNANLENFLDNWITLRAQTTLPNTIASSDPYVIGVFQALDGAINGSERIRSRLASMQLTRVFKSLEDIIDRERRGRSIPGARGKGNATYAVNIYARAQEQPNISRRSLLKRKQIASWWTRFAGPSPFFLIVYTEAAERVVTNYSKTDKQTLDFLASNILQNASSRLVRACEALEVIAERATRPDQTLESRLERQRAIAEVRHGLLGRPQ
ncbi:hypothetical protein F4803DRAFT_146297 [Xylaria telfairii]|nr:hypothetical protein F4803DRAFT_146297 [Xylaria telfairii]